MSSLWIKLPKPLQRRLARWCSRRPFRIEMEKPIISFTFDDFPRSALLIGGALLHDRQFSGTYYASFGLMGRKAPTGKIFIREDLNRLVNQKHELACHTFDHFDSWNTEPSEFAASLRRNQSALASLLGGSSFTTFSYPISWPRPETKRRVAARFECARGAGQTFNAGTADLNYLKAFFIEQSRDNIDFIERTIEANARAKGWLIFATHDVCDSPTRFGCTPGLFERILDKSVQSGASILSVETALRTIGGMKKQAVPGSHPGAVAQLTA